MSEAVTVPSLMTVMTSIVSEGHTDTDTHDRQTDRQTDRLGVVYG